MFRLPELKRLFRLPGSTPKRVESDVDRELEFHLAMRVDELRARGLSPDEASAEATRRFGNLAEARTELVLADRARAARSIRIEWLGDLVRDLRIAIREYRRRPLIPIVAILVLGLGVGLTTAMVSLFDRLALHPLPYPNGERLGEVWLATGSIEHSMRITPSGFARAAIVGSSDLFERVDAYLSAELSVEADGTVEMRPTRWVSPGLLPSLGARMVTGRTFIAEDSAASSPLTTILSFGTWRRSLGGRSDVVGQTVLIDGEVATVIGVLEPGFDLSSLDNLPRADYWFPLRHRDGSSRTTSENGQLLTRLRLGVTREPASRILEDRVAQVIRDKEPELRDFKAALFLANDVVINSFKGKVSLLLGAAALVLLVACANVAALLLGHATSRYQEFGVRTALGAGRGRVARQLATEAALLGLGGALLGLILAAVALAWAKSARPVALVTIDDVSVSGTTFLVALAIALLASIGFGLAPIWAVSRQDSAAALVGRSRSGFDGWRTGRLRSGLVVGQLALSLILLIGAGLLIRSFLRERNLPLGFDAERLGNVSVGFPERGFPTRAGRLAMAARILEAARALPGVEVATLSGNGPIDFGVMQAEFLPDGVPWPAKEQRTVFPLRAVQPDFFSVLRLPLVAGTTFSPDTAAHEIVIDQATAERYWPKGKAVGSRVRFGRNEPAHVIVGVAATQRWTFDAFTDRPLVYQLDWSDQSTNLIVRTRRAGDLPTVAAAVRAVDPGLRIQESRTVLEALDREVATNRFTAAVVAVFAGLTLALAAVGLYGSIAYSVALRGYEFAVRLALGAVPERVLTLVMRDGVKRILIGLAVGLLGSMALVRLIGSMLYRMSPWDPVVFGGAGLLLAVVGLVAAWRPARAASKADPLAALRSN